METLPATAQPALEAAACISSIKNAIWEAASEAQKPPSCTVQQGQKMGESYLVEAVVGPVSEGQCTPSGWVLVQPDRTQLIRVNCNDGYGASGIGEDWLELQGDTLTIYRSGGSNWRWTESWSLKLPALEIITASQDGFFVLGSNREQRTWNPQTLSGVVRWSAPTCDASGEPTETEGPEWSYAILPHLPALPAENIQLQDCAFHTNSAEKDWLLYGTTSTADDSRLSVLAVGDQRLLVEVKDDSWVGAQAAGKSWVYTDHLELWLGEATGYMDFCQSNAREAEQWGIGIVSDWINLGSGKGMYKPTVSRRAIAGGYQLSITVPATTSLSYGKGTKLGVTVVFSDSDDGSTQERLLGSSQLQAGIRASLGQLSGPVEPVQCLAQSGGLVRTIPPAYVPEKPVLL
jgi:hypothetical protein